TLGHENPGWRDRIGIGVKPSLAGRRRHADGPMTGATDGRLAPALERLVGADLVAAIVMLAVTRTDLLVKHVVQAFIGEVASGVRHPLLQAEMRFDDEGSHGRPPGFSRVRRQPG